MKLIQNRFEQLADDATPIRESKRLVQGGQMFADRDVVDAKLLTKWQTSVESLLSRILGSEAPTVQRFRKECEHTDFSHFEKQEAVLLSAKEEFEGGYLFELRNLVHADVFSDELGQASNWLKMGHKVAAAVIAGTVLETTVQEMCEQHPDIAVHEKLDTNNSSLARESVYNKMMAEQIRAWAKIRNSAAHGKADEFIDNDVTRMIDGIRDFIANHMN